MGKVIASTYEIQKKLGAGGGGIVYSGYHLRLNKQVVLKRDKREISVKQELLRKEVDTLKNISHTYIPQVYDYIEEDGFTYTVMDYIEGESFDKILQRGERFSQAQVIAWACQLLEALVYLHSCPPHGILHADIKPSNIMLTPQNDIRLIDFNIALALGEEGAVAVGRSFGYASPEHYGSEFLSGAATSPTQEKHLPGGEETEVMTQVNPLTGMELDETGSMETVPQSMWTQREAKEAELVTEQMTEAEIAERSAKVHSVALRRTEDDRKNGKLLDVRSDIYSLGATLYHLLSGKKPERNALDVVALSDTQFSPAVIAIIQKAMAPEPENRFQTATEMLYAFTHLHQNDLRTRKYKKMVKITTACLMTLFLAGTGMVMMGLRQMERQQKAYALAESAENVLQEGDVTAALEYALAALEENERLMGRVELPQAEKVLADALHVYDLSDGFQNEGRLELSAAPLCMAISPEGKTLSVIHDGKLSVVALSSMEITEELLAEESALSQVEYLNETTIVFAGEAGIEAYSLETGETLWSGERATGIAVSADKNTIAAVYKDENYAHLYRATDGAVLQLVDFGEKKQAVTGNDIFANPQDSLLALNRDATQLAVSFADGSLWLYTLADRVEKIEVFDHTSGFTHFEGGFSGEYFAFSASNQTQSVFAVIDISTLVQAGGFASEEPFSVMTDEMGIYVQTENILVKLDPITGEQIPLVTTKEGINQFSVCKEATMIATNSGYAFFDKQAELMTQVKAEKGEKLLCMANGAAVAGSMDETGIQIFLQQKPETDEVFFYDATYPHDEARINEKEKTAMLFSYTGFRIYAQNGEMLAEQRIPDADAVYDQQFRRNETEAYLEVIYYDGKRLQYSAQDGRLLQESQGEKPDATLYEEFYTDSMRIAAPVHGAPVAYDRESGRLLRYLQADDYITYVTQIGDYVLTEYVTADGERYGLLLDENCEALARLPGLCDILDEELVFDYHKGELRKIRIHHRDELISLANQQLKERGRML